MSFVLFNISNEIVTRENAGVAYQEGSNRVCIIFTGCRSREFGDKIHSICQEIQQKVKEVIGIETSIGIGSWVRSPQELVYSYKLAEKALAIGICWEAASFWIWKKRKRTTVLIL